MARRQLGHGRGGRMKIERDAAEVTGGRPPRAHARRPDRAAGRQPRLRQLGGADEPVAGRARRSPRSTCRAPVTPTSSARRSTSRATCATSSSAPPRARRPRASPAARCARRSCARSASRSARTSCRSPRCTRPARGRALTLEDFAEVDSSPVRCLDAEATRAMVREIDDLRKANESLGGVFEVQAFGLVPGPRLARLLGGAPRRAPGDGDLLDPGGQGRRDRRRVRGRRAARAPQAHDEIFYSAERGYYRETNRAGGLEGGMTNGLPLIVRGAMKPLPTLTKPLRSVDTETHEPAQALRERTDSCTVPAAGVVGEAMVAFVLADAYRQQVRRRPHRRRARGRRRLRGADRMAAVAQAPRRALVLIGFMGAGKSTVAAELAQALGVRGARQRRAAGGALRALAGAGVRAARRGGVPRRRGGARLRAARRGASPER